MILIVFKCKKVFIGYRVNCFIILISVTIYAFLNDCKSYLLLSLFAHIFACTSAIIKRTR